MAPLALLLLEGTLFLMLQEGLSLQLPIAALVLAGNQSFGTLVLLVMLQNSRQHGNRTIAALLFSKLAVLPVLRHLLAFDHLGTAFQTTGKGGHGAYLVVTLPSRDGVGLLAVLAFEPEDIDDGLVGIGPFDLFELG